MALAKSGGGVNAQPLTVEEVFKTKSQLLHLRLLTGSKGIRRHIAAFEVNRPGLALAGHLEHFRAERVQIIGRGEEDFIRRDTKGDATQNLTRILRHKKLPCVILTRGFTPPPSLVKLCQRFQVPLLQTALDTAHFVGELTPYLEERLAPRLYKHGVLVDVYGLGVFLSGESGVGKSECALELLKRGHIFIADDLVAIKRLPGEVLIGEAERKEWGHYMEVRGLGVIDVRTIFGIGSVMDRTRIEMVVQLELWKAREPSRQYERLGLQDKKVGILGVSIPHIIFPVFPGRNLAILIEVASLNQRLKNKGVFSAREFENKLLAAMTKPGHPRSGSARKWLEPKAETMRQKENEKN